MTGDFTSKPRVVTALVRDNRPRPAPMSITVDGIAFDRHHYDERGDVLYLNVGELRGVAAALESPAQRRRCSPRRDGGRVFRAT